MAHSSSFIHRISVLMCLAWGYSSESMTSTRNQGNKAGIAEKPHSEMPTYKVFQKLLNGYDSHVRPEIKAGPLTVQIEILVSNVFNVEEVNNEFSVEIYFRQFWRDSRLALKKYNITKSLFLDAQMINQIWVPSTYFVKSKRAHRHDITTDNMLMRVEPNGDLFYSQRLSITSTCVMNLRYFPHDRQTCNLTIESYAYQNIDVIYTWSNASKSMPALELLSENNLDLPSFALEEVLLHTGENVYTIGNHSYLVAMFNFKRRLGYFLIETYVPSCIIVVISWVSFWISPESAPARVSLGITTVLTMTTISSAARQSLPKVSYVKAIDWFLLSCLVFVFGALLEYAFVAYNTQRMMKIRNAKKQGTKEKKHLGTPTETPEEQRMMDTSCNGDGRTNTTPCRSWSMSYEEKKYRGCTGASKKMLSDFMILPTTIDKYSQRLFPFSFVLFNVVYWVKISLST